MGLESFELPCGSAGDVAELEYISALHQTETKVRLDGSVKAGDIRLYLASRYGIKVTEDQVKDIVLHGLGGEEDGVLDLVEIVACLMIPVFLKVKEQQLGNPLPNDQFIVKADQELIQTVLKTMIQDVTGSDETPELSQGLVQQILRAYGEHELAENTELLAEMVNVCSSDRLDKHSLATGLTHDTQLLDIANEGSLSTNLADVLAKKTDDADESEPALERALDEDSDLRHFTADLRQKKTFSHIDVTAGNFRSKTLIVLLWVTFAISYFAFSFEPLKTGLDRICFDEDSDAYAGFTPWIERSTAIACESVMSILLWLFYFIGLAVLGLIFISAGSTGNSVYCKDWRKPLLGASAIFVPIVILFFARGEAAGAFLSKVSLFLASLTALLHLSHAAYLGWPSFREKAETYHQLLASSVYDEMKLKTSAAIKLNLMVENALDVFQKTKEDNFAEQGSNYSKALQSYAKHGKKSRQVGGLIWAWKRLFGLEEETLKDGIWISSRLLASNLSQYIVTFYLLIAGVILLTTVTDTFNSEVATQQVRRFSLGLLNSDADPETIFEAVGNVTTFARNMLNLQASAGADYGCGDFSSTAQEVLTQHCFSSGTDDLFDLVCDQNADVSYVCAFLLDDGLTVREQLALLTGSGVDDNAVTESLFTVVERATETAINSLYPNEEYMLTVPIAVATVLSFVTTGYLAISYIPSVMYTILKLRTGVIPSLRDPRFFKLRETPDLVAILTGSIFWGTLGSGLVVGIIVGLFVFFFLWQATAYYSQRFVAVVVGFLGVTILRVLFLQSRRKRYFRSWYRERPGQANLLMLALEWAYFSLAAGFIVVRLFKLLLCAAFNVGRIDTPFLAPGVGRIGNIELDHYHIVHLQDILAHEAHRHPYMELLGVIYMMKLRHGERFGSRAGSTWRLIFVHALLPWLQHYRIQARPEIAGRIQNTEGSLVRAPSAMILTAGYAR